MVVAIAHRSQCIFLHVGEGQQHAVTTTTLEFVTQVAKVAECPLFHDTASYPHSPTANDLMTEFKSRAKHDNRCMLLISGFDLEDQVTVRALHALLEGFDVHLLCDMITTSNNRLELFLLLRLFQAGAVPSSLRQFLYMWMTNEADSAVATQLSDLYEKCSEVFGARPA